MDSNSQPVGKTPWTCKVRFSCSLPDAQISHQLVAPRKRHPCLVALSKDSIHLFLNQTSEIRQGLGRGAWGDLLRCRCLHGGHLMLGGMR